MRDLRIGHTALAAATLNSKQSRPFKHILLAASTTTHEEFGRGFHDNALTTMVSPVVTIQHFHNVGMLYRFC